MPDLLVAMGAILLTWAVLAAVLVGNGLLGRRLFGPTSIGSRTLVLDFWMGFCLAIAYLQIWHMMLAIHWSALIPLAVTGAAGIGFSRRRLKDWWCAWTWRRALGTVGAVVLVCWVANRAIGPNNEIDSHLYHYPTILWLRAFPMVPGLANLYAPFGSNSSILLFDALLDSGLWEGRAYHIANPLLLAALFVHGCVGVHRLVWAGRDVRAEATYDALMLVPAVQMTNHWMVSGFSTDVAPAVLAMIAGSQLVRLLVARYRKDRIPSRYELVFLCTVLCTALCCKLTCLAFSAVAWLLALGLWTECRKRQAKPVLRPLAWALAASVLLVVPWLGRGVVASGYPLYPATIVSVPVDWRLPRDIIEKEVHYQLQRNRLRHYYDHGHEDAIRSLQDWTWIRYWITLVERETVVPTVLALIATLAWIVAIARRRVADGAASRLWVLALLVLPAIAFWFITQAEQRMGFFLFWIAGASLTALVVSGATWFSPSWRCRAFAVGVVLLAAGNIKKPYTLPGPDHGFHQNPLGTSHAIETRPYLTDWGVVLNVPTDSWVCSNTPLPATITPNRHLRLRDPGSMGAGFRIDRQEPLSRLKVAGGGGSTVR